jgi:hypothetical protein
MSWEIISGICAVIAVLYLFYQFHYLPKAEVKETKTNLLAQYNMSRKLIDSLIIDMEAYITTKSNYTDLFTNGITFGSYLAYLKNMRDTELSQEFYNKLSAGKFTKENMALMINNLEKQIHSFNLSKTYFDTTFKFR